VCRYTVLKLDTFAAIPAMKAASSPAIATPSTRWAGTCSSAAGSRRCRGALWRCPGLVSRPARSGRDDGQERDEDLG
jgi:hypothetical protein